MNQSVEHVLEGGNVAELVVRVGSTVRKPATVSTAAVEALLDHFAHVGFSGARRCLGRDELGRHVVEYVPGEIAYSLPPLTASELRRLGAFIQELHDAAESFKPPAVPQWNVVIAPDREDLICHHDLAPWNLVRDGERWVFIDWDGAGPGSRLWDLARVSDDHGVGGGLSLRGCGFGVGGAYDLRTGAQRSSPKIAVSWSCGAVVSVSMRRALGLPPEEGSISTVSPIPASSSSSRRMDRCSPARSAIKRIRCAICRARTQVNTCTRMLCSVQWNIGENETTWRSLSCRKENSASDWDR